MMQRSIEGLSIHSYDVKNHKFFFLSGQNKYKLLFLSLVVIQLYLRESTTWHHKRYKKLNNNQTQRYGSLLPTVLYKVMQLQAVYFSNQLVHRLLAQCHNQDCYIQLNLPFIMIVLLFNLDLNISCCTVCYKKLVVVK